MNYCYVEFKSASESALHRLHKFFTSVKAAKDEDEPADEALLAAYLTDQERSYFWNPTPDELAEWNDEWFSTPLPRRHSAEMPHPPWDFGSMLEAFSDGDYDLIGIHQRDTRHQVEFHPHGYPYGGTGSFVALIECFGHQVIGMDDGTGYVKHVPRANTWRPKSSRVL